ncbi:putative beta-13-galactosyltransferase 14 [Zea mays]|uniref:Putative beta-13-galactosyltransferase 14 n=1 Tax=Zea mays TaxID=4577 RepID=A0A1D6LLC0_MAIZE|nr:putative beta-13-galactosyltransferase 14 [Zea mays]
MAPPRAPRSSRPRSPPDRAAVTRWPSSGSSPGLAPSAAAARCAGRGSPRIARVYFGQSLTGGSHWSGIPVCDWEKQFKEQDGRS